MTPRHFLDLDRLDRASLRRILDMGMEYKRDRLAHRPLAGKMLAMIFEKPSTRTRVSFEVGIRQLGGDAVILSQSETQLGRGETIADTARVLSRYVDAIMMRTNDWRHLQELVQHATVPVINGLTDVSHPCQVMADVMTFEEKRGSIKDARVTWSGDGNNVCNSWIHAAAQFGFTLNVACPPQRQPADAALAFARAQGAKVTIDDDAARAAAGADLVVTDTWSSMHAEANGTQARENLHNQLAPYRVDARLMARAKPDAMFMHCLPAHRGEEVTAEVIDGPRSVVWDEAENRLHVQKGILTWCMT